MRFIPRCENRARVVYGGVDTLRFSPPPEGVERSGVISVGRLIPQKGQNYLVEGLPAGMNLTLIGRPYHRKYAEYLRGLSRGKSVDIQSASDETLVESYRQAEVVTLPAVYTDVFGVNHPVSELFPLVLLEAWACGTPVVCTTVGGMPEVVEDGKNGFLVPPNDPRALGDAVRYLHENPREARQMGREGRRLVEERFTWDAVAERCLRAYSEIA
jgi:glycosyltransferase involved in cell wall biosynthesis